MNCERLDDLLPLYAYGDLSGQERAEANTHLGECSACRAKLQALDELKRQLAATPVPAVSVDVCRLLAEAASRQSRRWRRVAMVSSAIAACLLLVIFTRWEVRAESGELVIGWAHAAKQPSPPAPLQPSREREVELVQKLQQLDELTRALAAELADRDVRRVGDIDSLRTQVDTIHRTSTQRWQESRRDFDALYAAHFKPVAKGDVP